MTIESLLVVSTANIKESTATLLNLAAERPTPDLPIVYAKDEYGWFIYITGNGAAVPPELDALLAEAQRQRCEWLLLDRDADPLPRFPVFDW